MWHRRPLRISLKLESRHHPSSPFYQGSDGASTAWSCIVTARAFAYLATMRLCRWASREGGLRRLHNNYEASTCCRLGTLTLWATKFLQATHKFFEGMTEGAGQNGESRAWHFVSGWRHSMTAGRSMSATWWRQSPPRSRCRVAAPGSSRRGGNGPGPPSPRHRGATYRQPRIRTRGFQQLGCSTLIWLGWLSAEITLSSTIMRS